MKRESSCTGPTGHSTLGAPDRLVLTILLSPSSRVYVPGQVVSLSPPPLLPL